MNIPILAQAESDIGETIPLTFWEQIIPRKAEWWAVVGGGAAIIGAMLYVSYFTRAGVISRATTKEAIRQPMFLLLMLLAIVLNGLNTFLPFFSFGDDVKMLMDCGLATILITGLLMGIWTSSLAVADEIEGKTAMTLLSKPINRRQFIIGKYVGIMQSVLLMLLPVILLLLPMVLYRIGMEGKGDPEEMIAYKKWQAISQLIPNASLAVLEISVLVAVSVAISTRLPMVVNIVTTFAIFVVGHLTPILVQGGVLQNEPVEFMARLFATILPSLELFNTQTAVATETVVPAVYIGFAALYCACYVAAAIFLAFLLFEDRDLA